MSRVESTVEFIDRKLAELGENSVNGNAVEIESAAYKLITSVLSGEEVSDAWDTVYDGDSIVAIVNTNFLVKHPEYIEAFKRSVSHVNDLFRELVKRIVQSGFTNFETLTNIQLPVVFLQIDDITVVAKDLGIEPAIFQKGLDETPDWKASEVIVFASDSEPDHDLPSYIRYKADELGLSIEELIARRELHEKTHLIADNLTNIRFGEYHTWFNEGFCEIAAGLELRALSRLQELKLEISTLTIEDIFYGKSTPYLYGGGWLLLSSIGRFYNDRDIISGVIEFAKELFDDSGSDQNLNQKTLRLLINRGILDDVQQYMGDFYSTL